MRNSIPIPTYVILTVINVTNLILCIISFVNSKKCYAYLTMWTLLMNSIYLVLNTISDTYLFFTSKQNLEYLHDFSRNKMAPVANSYSYMVFISFWGMVCMGSTVMKLPTDAAGLLSNIYLHALITVFVIVDIYLSDHEKLQFNWIIFAFLGGIFILYSINVVICIFVLDFPPYPFMKNAPFWIVCVSGLGLFVIVILGYFIHIGLLALKFKVCGEKSERDIVLPEENQTLRPTESEDRGV